MQVGHLLLGRPWQFDRHVFQDGYKNRYTLKKDGKRFTLAPLTAQQLYEDQLRIQKICEENKSERDKEENKSEKEKEREKKREKESMNERENEGIEKRVSLYEKERDMRCAFESMNLLMYKEAYLHETNHNSSLPSIVVSILQEPKDYATHIATSNDRASKLDLPSKFNGNAIFNVSDLFPFDVGDYSRTSLSEERGNDGDHGARDPVDQATTQF